jgi:hypothetical protein
MAARTTMATLILRLRGLAQAGANDYTVASVAYWTDNQLQDILDNHRNDVYNARLTPLEEYQGGTPVYLNYYSGYTNLEETAGGTAVFYITDGIGAAVGTALYIPDYQRGAVTFAADTKGVDYYLYGRSYDMNAAAAEVWRTKAGQYAMAVNFSTDNHRIDRGKIIENCFAMADKYDRMSWANNIIISRNDNAY